MLAVFGEQIGQHFSFVSSVVKSSNDPISWMIDFFLLVCYYSWPLMLST